MLPNLIGLRIASYIRSELQIDRRRRRPVARNFDDDYVPWSISVGTDHDYPRDLSAPDGGHESAVANKRARVAEATEAAIQGLSEVMPNRLPPPAECAVCLKDFDDLDKLRAMPCAHAFHEECIFRWLRLNAVCPLCRHPLPTQEDK